jgi:hypothetical protein
LFFLKPLVDLFQIIHELQAILLQLQSINN